MGGLAGSTGMDEAIGTIRILRDAAGGIDAPCGIIAARGDVWFTSIANARIGRVRAAGGDVVETFADPRGRVRLPANLHPAADGRLWFTCLGADALGSLDPAAPDPSATIRLCTHPDLLGPVAIKSAPSGLLWCTLRGADAIASVDPLAPDPAASVRLVRAGTIADPSALFIDGLGAVWWVNAATATLGRLDPAAPGPGPTVRCFGPWPGRGAPRAWAPGCAGALWVTTQDPPGLLLLDAAGASGTSGTPAGAPALEWRTDSRLRTPDGVWTAPDCAVWLADTAADAIVRCDPRDGGWASFTAPGVDGPFDIKPGPDRAWMWFTNKHGGSIGRIKVV